MKRLAVVFAILCLGVFAMFIERDKKKRKRFTDDDPEDEITGPHGEPILVGAQGGKFYFKGDRKVYLRQKKDK